MPAARNHGAIVDGEPELEAEDDLREDEQPTGLPAAPKSASAREVETSRFVAETR